MPLWICHSVDREEGRRGDISTVASQSSHLACGSSTAINVFQWEGHSARSSPALEKVTRQESENSRASGHQLLFFTRPLSRQPAWQVSPCTSPPTPKAPEILSLNAPKLGCPALSVPPEGAFGEQPVPGPTPHPRAHSGEPVPPEGALRPVASSLHRAAQRFQ